ncbi:LysM peptidoglycan-binding domain-containing protein, partial [bacterium]|nr:LysM peptidoglycan-binding domain-containing protein [bacterium]
DPDSEESRSLVDPVMSDEEMRPEKMVWQAWQAEGDIDFGFKSRTAYNRLLTYLDQAGYGKYLRFKKILNSMATDEAWVEEIGKRLDEEAEFKDLLEKASGKTVTSRMERLKMAIPTKEETFEVMRLTNVYAKDGRVAQLLEPIDKAIQYPLVTLAESRAQDEAIAMFAKAQKEVERLVRAKEYKVLRENPRFAEETKAILEEINAGYQKFLSEKVALADIETSTESEAREKEESQQRVAKRKISEAKLPDKFSPIRLQAAIEQINRNAIQRAVATPSINDRIKGVLKSLEEVGQNLNSLSTSRETATLALLRMIEVSGGKPDFLAKKRINKNIKALEREINRHQVIEKRLLFVLEELEGIKDLSKIEVEEKVDEGKRLTKAQLDGLPQRVQKEIVKRKFKEDFPVYEGTLRWEDPRVGKGTVVAKTLSQVISKTGNTTQFNTVLVSYLTASGEVPLATYANGIPIGREDGKALASAYYAQGGKSIIATPQIAGEAPSLSRIEPVGMFLRGDKFYTPAPEPAAPRPKVKILELPMAQRFSKDEPEVNARGERWYEFTLDPENKRSHQRVYVRATDHLEAIRKAIAKMTEKGQTVLYKGKHYSQREPERTIRVPVNEGRPETIAGLTQDELAIRKAIRMADVARMRELIENGKARDEDYRWFAKQEAEATITGLYEDGRELEDSQVISLAKEFGLIDLSGDRKPDFRRLKQLRELALSKKTPKTMGVSRNVGRSGVIKDVSVNMALFGNQSSTKEVPAPEQTYKLPELPRKTSQDVLQEIADQNGTTVEDIKRVNNMSGAALAPGASLLIPGTTRSVKVPDYNLVQEGPSLFKIAKKFGITREELAKANNLPEDYILKPGDELVIPATKFKDTTKELVDRLFKERVYEAGPTMLRVNTPPPGIRIVNQDGEPAAATTIEPDEERKIELLKSAELPGKAKTAVEKSFEKGESFMEALTKLGEILKELKRDNPELFREQNNRLETDLPSAATELEKPIWAESGKVSRQKHTYFLTLRPYGTEVTEAYGRKESIGKNLFKLFRKNGSVVYNGRRYTQNQIGLLTYLINNNRGWADPVRRIDYNEDGSINAPVAASEVEPSGEEAERIYRARRMSQKKEGKQKVRGFVRTYGNDGEIDKDLRDAAALSSIRYHVRTQPLRAEEAMELIKKGGGAVAVARELIAPETDNQEIAAISNNPIEFDNLVILNTILIKQLDKTHKAAKALGNNATAAEAMNLSLQLVGKQAVLGTRLGRGLAAFAAYSRLSPAGWRYFLTQ